MNDASRERVERAKWLAEVYASHPDVRAIVLGGSSARGSAHETSDIDLGLFWEAVPSQETREALLQRAGGRLRRRVDNRHRYDVGNPRREGCIEIATLGPMAGFPYIDVDIEHETVAGTQDVLAQVLDEGDLSLEKQELLSVLQSGIILYGHDTADTWRARARTYPDEVVSAMVSRYCIGIGKRLPDQARWAQTADWLCFYDGLLDVGRRLVLTLLGLNRVWAFTDNPNLKGLKSVTEGLAHKPVHFVDRLGYSLQCSPSAAIEGFADLTEEVLDLVVAHLPAMNVADDRASLRQVRFPL